MMMLTICMLFGLFAIGLTLTLASPLGGLQLALALLGIGAAVFGAVVAGIGGLALGVLATMVGLALAAGAVVLGVLLVPVAIALAAAVLLGLAPLLLPVALVVGLVWAIVRASRSSAAHTLPPVTPAPALALPAH